MNAINSELKDAILKILCETIPAEKALYGIDLQKLVREVNSNEDDVLACLKYFERKGFITKLNAHRVATRLVLMVEGVEFHNSGGFRVQEQLLKANIDKLTLEIKKLQPSWLEKGGQIAGIIDGIQSAMEIMGLNK